MPRRAFLMMLGMTLALVAAEVGVRFVANVLPDPRAWPTPETEIKISQIDRLQETRADLDVVFVGSSVLESGIDPALLEGLSGISSYNAALPFSSPLSNDLWLRDYVLPRLHPDAVVIGLGVWPTLSTIADDMLANGLTAIDAAGDDEPAIELVRRRRQLRNWSDTVQSVRRIRSGAITELGHQTVYYSMSRAEGDDPEFSGSRAVNMSDDNYDALVGTIEHLQALAIEPIILIEPIGCPPIRESCPSFDLETHPGRRLAAEYGLQLIDAASRNWPDEMYADSAHLNRVGVELFTRLVSTELAQTTDR